jgi:rhodanese-related sulfurtransferase
VPIPEISVLEAHALLSSPNPPRLIDVREGDEWEHCRIPGAELLPLSQFGDLAPERLSDANEPLVIYCHHGGRSARATEYLMQQGFANVTNLAGGIDAWSVEIDPSIPRY